MQTSLVSLTSTRCLPAVDVDSSASAFHVLLIDLTGSKFSMSVGAKKTPTLFAQRGVAEELNISGTQLVVALAVAIGVTVPLIWWFVQFASSAP